MPPAGRMHLICYTKEIIDGQPIYVSSNCLPIKALNFEPAGHSFHFAALRLSGLSEEENTEDDKSDTSNDKEQTRSQPSDSYSSKGKKKSGSDVKQDDYYALLGLSHLRYLASEDQIRKSYRETALKHHPDKQAALLLAEETVAAKEAKKDEIETRFKAIQEAYEVLIDPVRRRIYDSTDEFDDEIPTDCAPHDFFKVFGPAFLRNGRWSVNEPVPSLGDDKSSIKYVDSFYDFWYSFKSWREFPHADEFDLEQAESRDHRRWMERQNAKLAEKARKEEYARIRTLVDNAYRRDPRILRRKEEEKAEKQRKKEAKIMAKKLQEEEAAKIVEEEKRRKEDEDKKAAEVASQQKKVREKEKKLLRKEKSRLRTLLAHVLSHHLLDITKDDVEGVCLSLDIDQLKSLCDNIEGKEELERAKILKSVLVGDHSFKDEKNHEKSDHSSKGEKQHEKSAHQNGSLEVNEQFPIPSSVIAKTEKPWGKEEIELLRKGTQKYPKGTSRRWEVISEYIGTGRSVEEILKATKTVLLQKPDTAKAFDSFLEKRKPSPSIESPLTTREQVDGVSSSNALEGHASKSEKLQQQSPDVAANHKSPDLIGENGVSLTSDQDIWSAIQERALIQALKTFPKEASQRWERVAAAVPGKTVNQCKKKFVLLKDSFRSKK